MSNLPPGTSASDIEDHFEPREGGPWFIERRRQCECGEFFTIFTEHDIECPDCSELRYLLAVKADRAERENRVL